MQEEPLEELLVEDRLLAQFGAVRKAEGKAVEGRNCQSRSTEGWREKVDAHLEVRVEEADRFHQRDGVVGLGEDDADEIEDERQVEQEEGRFVRFGRRRIVLL